MYRKIVIVSFILGLVSVLPVKAQLDKKYRMANQLLQQEQYEEAYNIYKDLLKEHPNVNALYERATKCLINLKKYDEAINLSRQRLQNNTAGIQTSIRLAEIYHIKGDTAKAFEIWNGVINDHSEQLHTYLKVARTMKSRNAYSRAINIYERAQQKFSNDDLFSHELATSYMLAGNFEKAINEYLSLIKSQPARLNYIKNNLMRFNDEQLLDIAIVNTREDINQMSPGDKGYKSIYKLQEWLLMERGLYKRALEEAKQHEEVTSHLTRSVYHLGTRLLSQQKFALAEDAFRYYLNKGSSAVYSQSMEKLGDVYRRWGNHLVDYHLVRTSKQDSLFREASETYSTILEKIENYEYEGRVLMKMADLALDHLNEPGEASTYLKRMKNTASSIEKARIHYLEGRLLLYKENYDRARIALTRGQKQAKNEQLGEKIRYFLALTDFYAGDFSYAKLQLKALEKQNASYFANDAIKLGTWIQDGMQKDSVTRELQHFSHALRLLNHGQRKGGLEKMTKLLDPSSYHDLKDDALLLISTHASSRSIPLIYSVLDSYFQSGASSPLRERLLWERAQLAYKAFNQNLSFDLESDSRYSNLASEINIELTDIPAASSKIQDLYERILLEYPQGFYASYARDRIQELKDTQIQ